MEGLWTIGIILVGVILVAWLFYNESRKKHDIWSGVLENKKINKYLYKGKARIDYLLYFRKDAGKTVMYNANEEVYNMFEKGDRAEKRKDEYYPKKIGS